ncbi:MAG TPA: cyanophycin synthetase [Rhodocyclaceae bacterium]|nr:cyanophycin synthetase [Rhodocyclaceae bacterium]
MTKRNIEFLRVTCLKGPNIWTYRQCLEAWVDIGDLEDNPSNTLPGFVDRLVAWLPSLMEHKCSVGERGGFVKRLRDGTWAAHILEHVTLELQNLAGMQSGFGKARETSKRGIYKVAVRARDEQVSRACLEAARNLVLAAINDEPFDVAGTVRELREKADSLCLGPSTACIVNGATDRGIPSLRLTDGNLVQLGYGNAQRRIWTAETDCTSAIAEEIACDKDLTKQLLSSCGVPVPEGQEVDSPEEAWEAAEDIGLPVVVKPTDGNHGRGVFTNLRSRQEVESAFAKAQEEGSGVIVERFIEGGEHRLLVVGNQVVAVTRGDTASVVGDGVSTIRQLVDSQINSDPRRGEEEDYPLGPINIDQEPVAQLEIERQGYTADSVPPKGEEVLIVRHGNMAFDATDEVHPDTAAIAALAARIVGLDIAGIDLVTKDISKPLAEQRGAIVEVNAGPSLLMHIKPAVGQPRPVGEAIVKHLFPRNSTGRIPVVGVTGSGNLTLVARLVAWLLHFSGRHVGLACGDGLFLDRRQVEKNNCANWAAGQRLLINRSIDSAVFENSAAMILGEGLAYDRCDVGVVTGVRHTEDLNHYDVLDEEQTWKVLRTQVDVVLPSGVAVLNADDPKVAEMAELCDGEVMFYALSEANPVVVAHRAKKGRALFVRAGQVVLANGTAEIPVLSLEGLPLLKDEPELATDLLLAALGAASAVGISPELLLAGVDTFTRAH